MAVWIDIMSAVLAVSVSGVATVCANFEDPTDCCFKLYYSVWSIVRNLLPLSLSSLPSLIF